MASPLTAPFTAMRRLRYALLAVALSASMAAARAQTAVFVDLRGAELAVASAHLSFLLRRDIRVGPGAQGRITITSPRAMTFDEVLRAFERELTRNGLMAVSTQGNGLLVMPAGWGQASSPNAGKTKGRAPPAARYQPLVLSSRSRAESLVERLVKAGVKAKVETVDEYGTPGYGVVVEVGLSEAARRTFAKQVAAAGLSALISIDPPTPEPQTDKPR